MLTLKLKHLELTSAPSLYFFFKQYRLPYVCLYSLEKDEAESSLNLVHCVQLLRSYTPVQGHVFWSSLEMVRYALGVSFFHTIRKIEQPMCNPFKLLQYSSSLRSSKPFQHLWHKFQLICYGHVFLHNIATMHRSEHINIVHEYFQTFVSAAVVASLFHSKIALEDAVLSAIPNDVGVEGEGMHSSASHSSITIWQSISCAR